MAGRKRFVSNIFVGRKVAREGGRKRERERVTIDRNERSSKWLGRLYAKDPSRTLSNVFIQLSINGWFGHLAVAPTCLNHVYIAISDRDARLVSLSILSNAEINVIRRRKEIRREINSTLEILSISAYYCTHCDFFRFLKECISIRVTRIL